MHTTTPAQHSQQLLNDGLDGSELCIFQKNLPVMVAVSMHEVQKASKTNDKLS